MFALRGVAALLFGVLVFLFPGAGALALVWLISVYAIASGVVLLIVAFQLRRHPEQSWRGGMGQPAI